MALTNKPQPRRLWLWAALLLLVIAGVTFAVIWLTLPDVAALRKTFPRETSLMRFRAEEARLEGQTARRLCRRVPLSAMSHRLIQAVLISEDDKFFQHEGFDWESMRQAMEKNIQRGRISRGGSTITQQLAKNLYLTPRQSLLRKAREAAIAWKLERELSKGRILELYLNVIEWGPGVYGAEAAARFYFGVPAASLNTAQAIRLASVLPNPIRFKATANDNRRMRRKRRIIALRMKQRGWIDADEYLRVIADLNAG
jgi:monofunctional glycosyltransferase